MTAMFGVDELRAIVPPPASPRVTATPDAWLRLFKQLGTRLPGDFVSFHSLYGEGCFYSRSHRMSANVIPWSGPAFAELVPRRLWELRELRERRPRSVPFPLFWEPSGLLPWGTTTNGVDLCWLTRGTLVDQWPVIVLRVGAAKHEAFDMSALQFLARVAARSITCTLLPEHFPGREGAAFEVSPLGPTQGAA